MNVERLKKLRDHLAENKGTFFKGKKYSFDMRYGDPANSPCGTACCLIGHTKFLFPKLTNRTMGEIYDLMPVQAEQLFMPNSSKVKNNTDYWKTLTLDNMLHAIDTLIETGMPELPLIPKEHQYGTSQHYAKYFLY